MQRLITVIAMVFAFAAAGGMATNHALAYSSAMVVAPPVAEMTACAEADPGVVVSFKTCGKKQSGIVMPCNWHAALLPQSCGLPPARAGARFEPGPLLPIAAEPIGKRLRPPIAA